MLINSTSAFDLTKSFVIMTDPVTLEKSMDNLVVYDYDNTSVDMLNELEYIDGEIWSNVWQQDVVLRIDPDTGRITGKIDFTGLLQDEDKLQGRVVGPKTSTRPGFASHIFSSTKLGFVGFPDGRQVC